MQGIFQSSAQVSCAVLAPSIYAYCIAVTLSSSEMQLYCPHHNHLYTLSKVKRTPTALSDKIKTKCFKHCSQMALPSRFPQTSFIIVKILTKTWFKLVPNYNWQICQIIADQRKLEYSKWQVLLFLNIFHSSRQYPISGSWGSLSTTAHLFGSHLATTSSICIIVSPNSNENLVRGKMHNDRD